VLALVAFDVTVKVAAPELLNVVEPDNPVPEVAKVRVFANDPENEEAVQTPVALIVVAFRNAVVETPVALKFPANPPTAVIVPALKLPDASLATIADAVLALVAFDVTVKVAAPELLNVVEPDNPVPEVAKVRVFANDPENDDAVTIPVALTVVALRNPTVETPVEFTLPFIPPDTVRFPSVPTLVRDELTTPDPSAVELRTEVPLISYCLPVTTLISSDEVHAAVELTQLNVLSVAPFSVIPPPSAVTSVGDATSARIIFLSSITRLTLLRLVVVPFTVRFPVTVRSPPTVAAALTFTVVALRNATVETPVAFTFPLNPPLAVILVKVAVVPERVGIVAAAPTFTVVA
jgi:hypothetical protein